MTDMDIANHFNVYCSKITGLRFKYKIKRLHKNNEWLIDQYCNKKRTIISIANEAGVNRDEVRKELRKLNIEPDYEITPWLISDSANGLELILIETISAKLPEGILTNFIRGLFDADGCIANAKGNSVGTVSMCDGKILMEWVKKQYPFFKIKEDNISKGLYILSLYKQDDKLSFLNSIYKNANIYLDRKYEMYLKTKLKIESKLIRNNKKKK